MIDTNVRSSPAVPENVSSGIASVASVMFISGCLFEESSGPYLTLQQTARHLQQRGHRVLVIGTSPSHDRIVPAWPVKTEGFRRYGPDSMHFAPRLAGWLKHEPPQWDVVSMQGVWMHTSSFAADWCIRHDRPFMITVHGNFNPAALRFSSWKKSLASKTFMRRVFEGVTCYQASTEIEYCTLRKYGIRNPVCVIGNGIEFPDFSTLEPPAALLPRDLMGRRTCLYLGRLFPIKGIDRLLRVWAKIRPSDDWQLVIAGGGTVKYRAELEGISRESGCRNVFFTGFVNADVKSAWLRHSELFVLPSYSEAFAMAPMEAFSYGTPVLLTEACGFPEASLAGAALEVSSNEEGIANGLVRLLAMSAPDLEAMGSRGLTFVRERYTWDIVCSRLESVYDWMQGIGPVPACLRLE